MKKEFIEQLKKECSFSGFSAEEIEGIADILIGDKDEVTEDELAALISKGKGFATIGQKSVDRRVATAKPKESAQSKSEPSDKKTVEAPDEGDNPIQSLLEEIRGLRSEVSDLKGENVRKSRAERAMSVYEGLGEEARAKRVEQVTGLSFKSDDDFDAFLESEKELVASAIKKQGADGVNSLGGLGGRSKSSADEISEEKAKEVFNIK